MSQFLPQFTPDFLSAFRASLAQLGGIVEEEKRSGRLSPAEDGQPILSSIPEGSESPRSSFAAIPDDEFEIDDEEPFLTSPAMGSMYDYAADAERMQALDDFALLRQRPDLPVGVEGKDPVQEHKVFELEYTPPVEPAVPGIRVREMARRPPGPPAERKEASRGRGVKRKIESVSIPERSVIRGIVPQPDLLTPTLLFMKQRQVVPSRLLPFVLWYYFIEEGGEEILLASPWGDDMPGFITDNLDIVYNHLFKVAPPSPIDLWKDTTITGVPNSSLLNQFGGVVTSSVIHDRLGGKCLWNILAAACFANPKEGQCNQDKVRKWKNMYSADPPREINLVNILRFLVANTEKNFTEATKGLYGRAKSIVQQTSIMHELRNAASTIAKYDRAMKSRNAIDILRCGEPWRSREL